MSNILLNVKSSTSGLSKSLEKSKKAMSSFASTTKMSTSGMGKFNNSVQKSNRSVQNITKDANRANDSFRGLTKGVGGFKQLLGSASFIAFGAGIGKAVQSANAMVETVNLFSVSMGENAFETQKFVDSMNQAFGFDVTNIQNTAGVFSLLARSMGMSSENSKVLSENSTKLAYDLASLNNVPIAQTMADIRSGLVGQSETMYKYGVDVTEASLKQEALNQGVTKSVRNMSQGEKMALRYAVTIRQTGLAQGDFARTINTPANQLKILSERFITLTRTIGTVFLPMLQAILPVINAIVVVLTNLFKALASFLGYVAPAVSETIETNFSGIEDGADNATDATNKATDALKKMKNVSLGMDELNVIPEPTSSSSSGNSEASGGIADFDLSGYDNMMDKIDSVGKKLTEKVKPILENILILVGLIGLGIGAWNVAKVAMGIADADSGLGKFLAKSGSFTAMFTSPSGQVTKISSMFGKWAVYLSPVVVAFLAIAGVVATLAVMIIRFKDLFQTSEKFRIGLEAIVNFIKSGFNSAGEVFVDIGKKIKELLPDNIAVSIELFFGSLSTLVKKLDLDFVDLLLTFGGIALLFTPAAPFGVALLAFEAITIAIRGIGEACSPVLDQVEVLGDGISEETKTKLEPFLETAKSLSNILATSKYTGEIISQETVDDVISKTSSIKNSILNELSVDKNKDLKNLESIKGNMNSEEYNNLLANTTKYYDETIATINTNTSRINELYETASLEHRKLKQTELDEIAKLESENQAIGISQLSETEIEAETIRRRMTDNAKAMSVEQLSEILKNSIKERDEVIKNAESQFSSVVLSAKRMKDAGTITRSEYNSMILAAEKTKNDTVKSAEEQYSNIYETASENMPEVTKLVDKETGEQITKFQAWKTETGIAMDEFGEKIKTKFLEIKTETKVNFDEFIDDKKEKFNNMVGNINTKATELKNRVVTAFSNIKTDATKYWTDFTSGLASILKGYANSAIGVFESLLNSLIRGLNKAGELINSLIEKANKLPMVNITARITPMKAVSLPRLASGGSLEAGQVFQAGEAGAELIGSYNNKTTVMPLENSGFVEAMYSAVYDAVTQAQSNGGTVIENILQLDGETVYKNQQKVSKNRGVDLGLGVFAR